MKAPPSRYRVVERGGRLVVLDSAVGGAPLAAKDLLPAMASDDGTAAQSPDYPDAGDDRTDTRAARLEAQLLALTAPARSLAPPAPAMRDNAASRATGGKRDDLGRLLWTTARWYDAKGPRTLPLSAAGERRLGRTVWVLLGGVIVALALIFSGNMIGWGIVVVAFLLARQAKPVAKLWIDRLADA